MNSYIRFFKEYLSEFKFKYLLASIVFLIQSIIIICIPLIYSELIDHALPEKNKSQFLFLVGLIVFIYIGNQLLSIFEDLIIVKLSESLTFKLRGNLNDKISRLSIEFFCNNSISDILSKYDKEITTVKNNCGYMLIQVVGNGIKLIIMLAFMVSINIEVTIISVIAILIYYINSKYWSKSIKNTSEENMKLNANVIEKVTENYNNVYVTKLYNGYNYAKKSFENAYLKFYENSIKLEIQYSLNINFSAIILFIATGLLWLIGGYAVINGTMTIGKITAMISYQSMLLSPIKLFSQFNNSLQGTKVALERIYYILDYEEDILGSNEIEEDIKSIKFRNVDFSYTKDRKILQNVNIEINSGEITAIIGLSGSGKSTITKLITGLYKVNAGEIYVNDKEIRDISVISLRDKISLITQNSLFFRDTILENLKLSNANNGDKMFSLSKKLDLYEHIVNLPKNWDTLLVAGASNLSEGQRKRLDILRGLLKDSSVIIFDESTAALDVVRRNAIFKLMNKLKRDKMVIFISHNLNELENADKIYVFDNANLIDITTKIESDNNYINMIKKELLYE